MICSTSWHLASLLQLSDGNASTALHLVIGNAMRCWARGRYKFSPCFKPTSYNNKQPRFFMRCSFGHIYGAVTTRVVNLGGRCAPTNAFRAATAVFSSSGMHWVSSVLAWRAFPPAGVLQNAKVLACVQGGPCNHGLDLRGKSPCELHFPAGAPGDRPGLVRLVPSPSVLLKFSKKPGV